MHVFLKMKMIRNSIVVYHTLYWWIRNEWKYQGLNEWPFGMVLNFGVMGHLLEIWGLLLCNKFRFTMTTVWVHVCSVKWWLRVVRWRNVVTYVPKYACSGVNKRWYRAYRVNTFWCNTLYRNFKYFYRHFKMIRHIWNLLNKMVSGVGSYWGCL